VLNIYLQNVHGYNLSSSSVYAYEEIKSPIHSKDTTYTIIGFSSTASF